MKLYKPTHSTRLIPILLTIIQMITAIMIITATIITTSIHNYNSTRPPSKSYWVHTTSPETLNLKKKIIMKP